MKRYQINAQLEVVRLYTIKEIFIDSWDEFCEAMAEQGKPIRQTIKEEVEKIIGCQDPDKGFALYICPNCHVSMRVPFTCKSRFCNTCGAKYAKDRALANRRFGKQSAHLR